MTDQQLIRRRAAEFLADEARDATALAIVAQRAHLDDWDEMDGMSRAEADAYLAAVLAAAGGATVTSTWPDGAAHAVDPTDTAITTLGGALAEAASHLNIAAASLNRLTGGEFQSEEYVGDAGCDLATLINEAQLRVRCAIALNPIEPEGA